MSRSEWHRAGTGAASHKSGCKQSSAWPGKKVREPACLMGTPPDGKSAPGWLCTLAFRMPASNERYTQAASSTCLCIGVAALMLLLRSRCPSLQANSSQ